MNKPITIAVLSSGLVPPEMLSEMQHWGLPIKFVENPTEVVTLTTREQVIDCLREAIEGDDAIRIRDTDLDVLSHYLRDQREGKLHLFDPETATVHTMQISYTVMPTGKYVIPWTDEENITSLLEDSRSYLKVGTKTGMAKVRFVRAEELFFGGTKAFITALVATEAAS